MYTVFTPAGTTNDFSVFQESLKQFRGISIFFNFLGNTIFFKVLQPLPKVTLALQRTAAAMFSEIAHILNANPDELFGLFYRSKDVQDENGDKGAAYLSALLKWAQTVMPEAAQETNDDDLEDWLDDDNSPFDIYYADEKDVVQRLLDIFLKLDRGWQKELIEDAEMYLDFQEKRKEKEQKLEQKG